MVRSIEYGPREEVEQLPDDLLSKFRAVAEKEFGALDQPVVALTNRTMEMMVYHDEMRRIEEGVERATTIHATIVDVIAEQSDVSRSELIEYCEQTSLSMYGDGDASDICERACEIAEQIDREELWPRFKNQAYQLHGQSDNAVVRHIREAMTTVVYGNTMNELRKGVQEQKRSMKRLQRYINEQTDFDIEESEAIYEVKTAYNLEPDSLDRKQNSTLDDWVDNNSDDDVE